MSERATLTVALPLGGIAWGGLAYLILTQVPGDPAIAMSLVLLGLAAACTATPILLAIHRWRRKPRQHIRATVVWRQATWVGLFVALSAVMQLARIIDPLLTLALVVALGLLESFWQRYA